MTKDELLAWFEKRGSPRVVRGMARFGIETKLRTFGIQMGTLLVLKKQLGKDHDLALELWQSGCYEARLLAALIGDPQKLTLAQMNAWAKDFENWADCDTVCFHLFDKTPLAWKRIKPWASSKQEFVKRAAFALLASLALHDKTTEDDRFAKYLPVIEKGAADERNFVKKGVSWALRSVGRRSRWINKASIELAERLASSDQPPCRWVGKDALRDLKNPKLQAKLARKAR